LEKDIACNRETCVAFAAGDIPFSGSSPVVGGGKLGLIGDISLVDPSEKSYGITIKGEKNNIIQSYIEVDCNGFKNFQASIDVAFPRAWMTPVPAKGAKDNGIDKVVANATTNITNLNDWMLTLSLNPCEIQGLDDVEMSIKEITYDNSDTRNPDGMTFPKDYVGTKDKTFRGFYIKQANLTLPKLYNKGSGENIEVKQTTNGTWSRFSTSITIKAWSKTPWQTHLNSIRDTNSNAYKYAQAAYELMIDKSANAITDLSDLQAIIQAKNQTDLTFLFATLASCNDRYAAEGLALCWTDKTVQRGKKYRYRIELIKNTGSIPVLVGELETQAVPHQSKAQAKITPIENEGNIILTWTIPEEPVLSYSLERSDDNGRIFHRLNKEPILMNDERDKNNKDMVLWQIRLANCISLIFIGLLVTPYLQMKPLLVKSKQ
jgi:hypothetical protein